MPSNEDLRKLSGEELVRRFEELLSSSYTDNEITFLREELLRRLGSKPLSLDDIARITGKDIRERREALFMSMAELARKANLATITIERMESGRPCHVTTKRKVLFALGEQIATETSSTPGEELTALPCHNGNRVRPLREARLMTQKELSREAKISLRTLHSIEKGARCRMDTMRRILLALGLRFENKDYTFPPKPKTKAL